MLFKLHYGLWYGGLVGIMPFMFNYAAEYSGATGTQHGILYTILYFVALFAKPIICSIADKYASHHHCLLFFVFMTLVGYGSLAVYPFFPNLINNHKDLVWALYCLAALVGNTSMCIVNSIADSLVVKSCQKKNTSYGNYRLWGPVGFGIFGAIWGVASEIPSLPKYTPGILTMVIILLINSIILAYCYDRDEFKVLKEVMHHKSSKLQDIRQSHNDGQQTAGQCIELDGDQDGTRNVQTASKVNRMGLLLRLAKRETSIFAYILIFTFCGIMTAIHWQFFFKYLQHVSSKDDKSFSTIAALALPVQALGGELVFFVLSGKILLRLGSLLTLVICLFSFAARYLLYAYLIPSVNVYWILLVELLQGPAFGLMYSVLTHQANRFSEKVDEILAESSSPGDVQLKNSLHATMQGVLGASFEGLGLGLGAMIGGLSYDVKPLLMWQIAGFSALIMAFLCLIVKCISMVSTRNTITLDNRDNYVTEAENHLDS